MTSCSMLMSLVNLVTTKIVRDTWITDSIANEIQVSVQLPMSLYTWHCLHLLTTTVRLWIGIGRQKRMLAAADMPCSNQRILPACGPTAANSLHASAVGEWDSLTETDRQTERGTEGWTPCCKLCEQCQWEQSSTKTNSSDLIYKLSHRTLSWKKMLGRQLTVMKIAVTTWKYKRFSWGRVELAPCTKWNDQCGTVVCCTIKQRLVNQQMCCLVCIDAWRYSLNDLTVVKYTVDTVSRQG